MADPKYGVSEATNDLIKEFGKLRIEYLVEQADFQRQQSTKDAAKVQEWRKELAEAFEKRGESTQEINKRRATMEAMAKEASETGQVTLVKGQTAFRVQINPDPKLGQKELDELQQFLLNDNLKNVRKIVDFYKDQNKIKDRLETGTPIPEAEANELLRLNRKATQISREMGQYSEDFRQWREATEEKKILQAKQGYNENQTDQNRVKELTKTIEALDKRREEQRRREQPPKQNPAAGRNVADNSEAISPALSEMGTSQWTLARKDDQPAKNAQSMDASMFVAVAQHIGAHGTEAGSPSTIPIAAYKPQGKSTKGGGLAA